MGRVGRFVLNEGASPEDCGSGLRVTYPFSWKPVLFPYDVSACFEAWTRCHDPRCPSVSQGRSLARGGACKEKRKAAQGSLWKNKHSTNLALKTLLNLISWEPTHRHSRPLSPRRDPWLRTGVENVTQTLLNGSHSFPHNSCGCELIPAILENPSAPSFVFSAGSAPGGKACWIQVRGGAFLGLIPGLK